MKVELNVNSANKQALAEEGLTNSVQVQEETNPCYVVVKFVVFPSNWLETCSPGEIAVGYLFTRYRFKWNEVDFSIYGTYGIVVNLLGTSLAMGLFTHVMKMDDAMLGIIACTSKIIASVFYALAENSKQFYLATLLDMVGGTSVIAMRSIASKLVPSEELGKVNSLFGVCEAVVPLIYQPMYSFVYNHTINVLPGAFFLVGGSLTLPTVFIYMYLYYLQKRDPLNGQIFDKALNHEVKTNEGLDMSDENVENPVNTKL